MVLQVFIRDQIGEDAEREGEARDPSLRDAMGGDLAIRT